MAIFPCGPEIPEVEAKVPSGDTGKSPPAIVTTLPSGDVLRIRPLNSSAIYICPLGPTAVPLGWFKEIDVGGPSPLYRPSPSPTMVEITLFEATLRIRLLQLSAKRTAPATSIASPVGLLRNP